jgi:hypothetical protein
MLEIQTEGDTESRSSKFVCAAGGLFGIRSSLQPTSNLPRPTWWLWQACDVKVGMLALEIQLLARYTQRH